MYRTLAASPTLRPYLLGAIGSSVGSAMATLGFLFIAYDLTGSAAQVSGIALAEATPYLLFGLIGGAVADRARPVRLILAVDSARAVVELATFILALTGHIDYPLLLAVAAALQLGGCFVSPSCRTLLPALAPPSLLPSANAVLDAGRTSAVLLAPAVTAAVLATTGTGGFFLVDALSFLASAVTIALVGRRAQHDQRPAGELPAPNDRAVRTARPVRTAIREVADFARTAGRDRVLRSILVTTFLVVTATTWSQQIGMLLLAEHATSHGKQLYALLMTALAAAGLAAGLALPRLVHQPDVRHYSAGGLVWGAGIALAAVPLGLPTLITGAVLQGIGTAVASGARSNTLYTTLRSTQRGQGFAAAATLLYLADVLSVAAGGGLAILVGTRTLMLAAGALTALVSVLGALATKAGKPTSSRSSASTAAVHPKPTATPSGDGAAVAAPSNHLA